jgi:type I restriction-modification system DNA methylase subunit
LKSRASLAKRVIHKVSKPVNYSLNSQKITFEFLKAHLWGAADILRGSLDPSEYRQPVMTLLFLKRLNDTFEENAEKLIKQGKNQREAWENKNLCILPFSRHFENNVLYSQLQ